MGKYETAKLISEIMLSLLTIVISTIAIIISCKQAKINLETTAFNSLNYAKTAFDMAMFKDKKKIRIEKYYPLIEDYLSVLNYVCSLYVQKRINKKRFRILYSEDIITIFSDEDFLNIINLNCEDFLYLRIVHTEIIQLKK